MFLKESLLSNPQMSGHRLHGFERAGVFPAWACVCVGGGEGGLRAGEHFIPSFDRFRPLTATTRWERMEEPRTETRRIAAYGTRRKGR